MLQGKTVVLGVTGSIAAYKIASLASKLVKLHANVHVLMTQNATNFITPITFETLTGNKCLIDTFDRNFQFDVAHVSLAKKADVMLIAPASANVIGKIANGIAEDMLTTTVMASTAPVLISPAMNTHMYENPIVQDNLQKLERFGYKIIAPAVECWRAMTWEREKCRNRKRFWIGFCGKSPAKKTCRAKRYWSLRGQHKKL